jgi:hypothetical protein
MQIQWANALYLYLSFTSIFKFSLRKNMYAEQTEALWSGIQSIVASAQNIKLNNQLCYYPETAVFIDEDSYLNHKTETETET